MTPSNPHYHLVIVLQFSSPSFPKHVSRLTLLPAATHTIPSSYTTTVHSKELADAYLLPFCQFTLDYKLRFYNYRKGTQSWKTEKEKYRGTQRHKMWTDKHRTRDIP
jgi:hypothetical protein